MCYWRSLESENICSFDCAIECVRSCYQLAAYIIEPAHMIEQTAIKMSASHEIRICRRRVRWHVNHVLSPSCQIYCLVVVCACRENIAIVFFLSSFCRHNILPATGSPSTRRPGYWSVWLHSFDATNYSLHGPWRTAIEFSELIAQFSRCKRFCSNLSFLLSPLARQHIFWFINLIFSPLTQDQIEGHSKCRCASPVLEFVRWGRHQG